MTLPTYIVRQNDQQRPEARQERWQERLRAYLPRYRLRIGALENEEDGEGQTKENVPSVGRKELRMKYNPVTDNVGPRFALLTSIQSAGDHIRQNVQETQVIGGSV